MAIVAFDTNVLGYIAGIGATARDERKMALADALVARVMQFDRLVFPIQVGLELHNLLVRKLNMSREAAAAQVADYLDGSICVASDEAVLKAALVLSATHNLQTFDAVILAASASAGCDILYSEDMQNGFQWNGVTVVDPFI